MNSPRKQEVISVLNERGTTAVAVATDAFQLGSSQRGVKAHVQPVAIDRFNLIRDLAQGAVEPSHSSYPVAKLVSSQ